jgi:hypothetical protein
LQARVGTETVDDDHAPAIWARSAWALTSQLDAEASFGASFEATCGDVVESLDQLDVAVEVVEPL